MLAFISYRAKKNYGKKFWKICHSSEIALVRFLQNFLQQKVPRDVLGCNSGTRATQKLTICFTNAEYPSSLMPKFHGIRYPINGAKIFQSWKMLRTEGPKKRQFFAQFEISPASIWGRSWYQKITMVATYMGYIYVKFDQILEVASKYKNSKPM